MPLSGLSLGHHPARRATSLTANSAPGMCTSGPTRDHHTADRDRSESVGSRTPGPHVHVRPIAIDTKVVPRRCSLRRPSRGPPGYAIAVNDGRRAARTGGPHPPRVSRGFPVAYGFMKPILN